MRHEAIFHPPDASLTMRNAVRKSFNFRCAAFLDLDIHSSMWINQLFQLIISAVCLSIRIRRKFRVDVGFETVTTNSAVVRGAFYRNGIHDSIALAPSGCLSNLEVESEQRNVVWIQLLISRWNPFW